ncbi:MAG: hypothetical protein ACT6Q5_01010 [Sphingopyxis solisilvae]|uniref:hypothetical protein n=1 Tax=Sphingopyxis solisilvae TaxID=1886788 RepID=UPI0040371B69
MPGKLKRHMSVALGALATTTLGGCYYGDVYGAGYASGGDCAARYGNSYYDYDGYAYDDGYGYDCYDASDYGGGFLNIGFGGGWYDNYYYPGHGLWMFDRYRNRYPLRDHYLNYWGGRRAWWKYHGSRGHGQPGRPGGWTRGDRDGRPGDGRPARPGGWQRSDRDNDGPRGGRPGRADGTPPAATPPVRPDRGPDRWQRGDGDNNRDRGAWRGGRPGSSTEAAPPATGNPTRPDRDRFRPQPVPQDGSAVSRPRPVRAAPIADEQGARTRPAPRTNGEMRRAVPDGASAPTVRPNRAPAFEQPATTVRQPAPPPQRTFEAPVTVPEARPSRSDGRFRGGRDENTRPD